MIYLKPGQALLLEGASLIGHYRDCPTVMDIKYTKICLWAIGGARNPNLQVVIAMRRVYVASIRLDFH